MTAISGPSTGVSHEVTSPVSAPPLGIHTPRIAAKAVAPSCLQGDAATDSGNVTAVESGADRSTP